MQVLIWILLVSILACGGQPPQPNPTMPSQNTTPGHLDRSYDGPFRFVLGPLLEVPVKRFGINLSEHQYWGTGQIMKNLIPQNPGFEGYHFRALIEVSEGSPDSFSTSGNPAAWTDDFWDDTTTYEVIIGPNQARSGRIATYHSQPVLRWQVTEKASPFQAGDWIILRKHVLDDPTGGWWPTAHGNARFSASPQVRPGSPGKRALQLNASSQSDRLELHAYFDSAMPNETDQPHLPLNGKYRLRFWAKALDSTCQMRVQLQRLLRPSPHSFFNKSLEIGSDYRAYEIEFDAQNDNHAGNLDLAFFLSEGNVLLDDVSLESQHSSQATAFRDATVQSLQQLNPGILRYWAGQLGDSLDNQISPEFAFKRSSYSRWDARPKTLGYNLPQFLELCRTLGAEPWYVVPIGYSQTEMANLIEYLAGSKDTVYGKRRAMAGQEEPWSQVFARIHLELGNEAWNGVFAGGNLPKAEVYGAYGSRLFEAARQHPAYDQDRFNLILGGQAVWAGRNATIEKFSQHHDTLAIAPYLLHKLDGNTSNQQAHPILFKEVDALNHSGYLLENLRQLKTPLAIYEVNLHTVQGIQAQEPEALVASAGAASALAAHMMQMRTMGMFDQCFYTLNQYDTKIEGQVRIPLWGAVRQLGEKGRKRPQFLALQLMNRALEGNQIRLNPQGKHLGSGDIKDPVKAWLFKHANGYRLVAVNLDHMNSHRFQLEGLETQVKTCIRLDFNALTDHNEMESTVRLQTASDHSFSLRPGGLALWEF